MNLILSQCPYWKYDKKKDYYYYVALLPKSLTGESLTEVEIFRITRNIAFRCDLHIDSREGAPASETTITASVLNSTGLNKDVTIWGEVKISTKVETTTKAGNRISWCDISIKHYIGVYHVATSRLQVSRSDGKNWPWEPDPNDKVAQALDPRN